MSDRAVITLIAAMLALFGLVPGVRTFVHARTSTATNACMNHLRQLEAAKEEWRLNYRKATNDAPSWADICPFLLHEEKPVCPHGGTYFLGRVGEPPRCSVDGALEQELSAR